MFDKIFSWGLMKINAFPVISEVLNARIFRGNMPPDHLRQTRVLLVNLASATRELAPLIQNMLHGPWINLVFYRGTGVRMGCGLHPSLPRSRFCIITQRSSGGALRDETKIASRETSSTLTSCLYTIINSIVDQHLGCFIGQSCRLWVVLDAQEWDIIVGLMNDKIRDLTRPFLKIGDRYVAKSFKRQRTKGRSNKTRDLKNHHKCITDLESR